MRSSSTLIIMLSMTPQVNHFNHGYNQETGNIKVYAGIVVRSLAILVRDVSQPLDSVVASHQFVPYASLGL